MEFEAYLEKLQADAEHHGSGVFSCDLNRMQRVLGAFQLASPEDYVLPVLAAAVLSGATWFRLEETGGSTCLSWDGPPLGLEQLQRLIPSIGSSGTPLAELAVALLAARQLGQVCLQSSHGRVLFRGPELVVDELGQEGPNTLILRRSVLDRLLRRSRATARILQRRARFAPLQLTPRSTPGRVKASLIVKSGEIRTDWLSAEEWVDLPIGPWGRGVLYFGQADWQLVRHGVTYSMPSPFPGLVAVWWSDCLPLDLSRKELQRGPEFQAWLSWLHEQLATFILTRNLSEHLALLVRAGRHSQQPLFLETPLFRRVDGSLANLSQLREEYREHGWLPVVSRPMAIEWEPQRVVILEKPHEQQLREVFSNWLNLDHLENQTNLPRLPADEEYVVRIPFFQGRGEAGLRRYPHFHGFRHFLHGDWRLHPMNMPYGMDIANETVSTEGMCIGELYWTLKLMTLDDTFQHLRQYHLLVMFAFVKVTLAKSFHKQFELRHPLEVLLEAGSRVQINHVRGKIKRPQLQEIASQLKLPLHSGEEIPLLSLLRTDQRTHFYMCCLRGPSDHVSVDAATDHLLHQLFLPNTRTTTIGKPSDLPVTGITQALLHGVNGPAQLVRRLVEYKQCGAHKMLESASLLERVKLALPELTEAELPVDLADLVGSASREMGFGDRRLNSAYLLLALAKLPALNSQGLTRESLLPLLLEWAEFEFSRETQELISLCAHRPEVQFRVEMNLAWSYLRSQRFQEARDLACSRPPLRAESLVVLGLAESLDGDLEAGLQHFRTAAHVSSESICATCVAETLMWLGRRDEAREACPDSDDRYTRMIRASLAESPEECLRLCDLVEQAPGSSQYFELHEMRGLSYWKLGRSKEAHHHLSRFLEARPDNSMLDLRESRMEQARRIVDSLSAESAF